MAGNEMVVRCRGLPFSASEQDIKDFLGVPNITKVGISMGRDGRPSGEAFVTFTDREGYEAALKKDRNYMGSR